MVIHPKHFYMIRHGETEANAARIMAGSLDSPLTQNGRNQAATALQALESLKIKPQVIVHSHLERARDTATIINQNLNAPLHEDPDLAEIHVGDWEGKPYEECNQLFTGWIDSPNGETADGFFERVKRGKNRALQTHPGPVLIVSHGGVFRAFAKLYGLDMTGVANCHLYEFKPAPHKQAFPWDIYQYDIESTVIRRPAAAFLQDQEEDVSEIA